MNVLCVSDTTYVLNDSDIAVADDNNITRISQTYFFESPKIRVGFYICLILTDTRNQIIFM